MFLIVVGAIRAGTRAGVISCLGAIIAAKAFTNLELAKAFKGSFTRVLNNLRSMGASQSITHMEDHIISSVVFV